MAEQDPPQMRPASPQEAPDPSMNYERADPQRESQGKMSALKPPPAKQPDKVDAGATNSQATDRQLNSQDAHTGQAAADQTPQSQSGEPASRRYKEQHEAHPPQPQADSIGRTMPATMPNHSMTEEEPLGWDLTPAGPADKSVHRHPRTEGKGGTP